MFSKSELKIMFLPHLEVNMQILWVTALKAYEYLKVTSNIFVLQALIYILKQKMVYIQ